VARDLGYRVALPQSQYVALSQVEDILSPTNRRRVEVRPEVRSMPLPTISPATARGDLDITGQVDELLARREPTPSRPDSDTVERDEGLLSGPCRLTNRAFDALDEMGNWVLGRQY
jgi:hypothetical protein